MRNLENEEQELRKRRAMPAAVDEKADGGVAAGEYNLGDDIGTKIGEGHDPVENASTL